MDSNFTDIALTLPQAAHMSDAAKVQELGAKQLKNLQKTLFKIEKKLQRSQTETKKLEARLQDVQQQITALGATQVAYENAAALLMKSLAVETPYQASIIYDKGKPISLRVFSSGSSPK